MNLTFRDHLDNDNEFKNLLKQVDQVVVFLTERFSILVKDEKRGEAARVMRDIQTIKSWQRNGMVPRVFPIDLQGYGLQQINFPPDELAKEESPADEFMNPIADAKVEIESAAAVADQANELNLVEDHKIDGLKDAQDPISPDSIIDSTNIPEEDQEELENVPDAFKTNLIESTAQIEELQQKKEEAPVNIFQMELSSGPANGYQRSALGAYSFGDMDGALALAYQALELAPDDPSCQQMVNAIKLEKANADSWLEQERAKRKIIRKIAIAIFAMVSIAVGLLFFKIKTAGNYCSRNLSW